MAKAVKELQFETPNKVGVLNKISGVFKKAGVNILHVWGCGEGSKGYFGVVTNNNAKAKKALKTLGFSAKERDLLVVSLPNKAGALTRISAKLAKANVSISSIAATTAGGRVALILNTQNNAKARRLI